MTDESSKATDITELLKHRRVPKLAFNVSEVARAIGVSKTTAYNLLRAGRIRSVRVGTRFVVPVGEVERFLEREAR